ncbi:serine hydrolase domain-containing protein [Streptacidiphilus neutrinimicus]|uniref:serine hydrolase domain-containing protein n=1 Tax=Streptacidiphilus neutrinimicus TaxID=105420 RepID=UPI0005A84929|nr:serine hydrolase domain-containing protein [Streptacidiphilus neutrinimicus]
MPYTTSGPVVARRPIALPDDLQDRLDLLARRHHVPGAQLVVDTGTRLVSRHTGTADVATGTALTADTAVPLGSLTKPYTAATVMLLADDGDLDLTDPVAALVPELRALPQVTVGQVLSHTGGLPSGPDSDTVAEASTAGYLARFCTAEDLLFTPGTGFSYSNAGYVVLGRVVESVTGMSWHEAVQALLLEPLGTVPAFLDDVRPERPTAGGHALNTASGRPRPARQNLAPVEAPAGALAASALDLAALGRALIGRSAVLPPGVAERMRRPQPGSEAGALADAWGLGAALYRQGDSWWCGHDGNAQGTSCHLRAEPDSGVVVAFTGNAGGATALWRDLADDLALLTGAPVPTAVTPPARGLPVAAVPDCDGTYLNGTTEYRVRVDADGTPTLSVDGDLPLGLACYQDLCFDLVDPATGRREPGGRFHRDPATGVVDRVQISGRTARRADAA